jgi:hypothetical protein
MPIEGRIKKEWTKCMALYGVLYEMKPIQRLWYVVRSPHGLWGQGPPTHHPLHPSANKCRNVVSRPYVRQLGDFARTEHMESRGAKASYMDDAIQRSVTSGSRTLRFALVWTLLTHVGKYREHTDALSWWRAVRTSIPGLCVHYNDNALEGRWRKLRKTVNLN